MISLSGFSDRSLVVFVDRTSQDTRSRLVNINYETRFDGISQRLGLTALFKIVDCRLQID